MADNLNARPIQSPVIRASQQAGLTAAYDALATSAYYATLTDDDRAALDALTERAEAILTTEAPAGTTLTGDEIADLRTLAGHLRSAIANEPEDSDLRHDFNASAELLFQIYATERQRIDAIAPQGSFGYSLDQAQGREVFDNMLKGFERYVIKKIDPDRKGYYDYLTPRQRSILLDMAWNAPAILKKHAESFRLAIGQAVDEARYERTQPSFDAVAGVFSSIVAAMETANANEEREAGEEDRPADLPYAPGVIRRYEEMARDFSIESK